MEKILEYPEVKRMYDYQSISSRKNDTTRPKIKSILEHMQNTKHPICKIIVDEKLSLSTHANLTHLRVVTPLWCELFDEYQRLQYGLIKIVNLQKRNGRELYHAIKIIVRQRICNHCNENITCYYIQWYWRLEKIIQVLKPNKISIQIIKLCEIQEKLQAQKISIKNRQKLIKKLCRGVMK